MTYKIRFLLSVFSPWKKSIPQNTCRNMVNAVKIEDTIQNALYPPRSPIVPGPPTSASMLTKENSPLMTPNPKPETYDNMCLLFDTNECATNRLSPRSALRSSRYKK